MDEEKDKIPVTKNEDSLTLEQLLAGVTEDNIHEEIDTGNPVGKEIW
jgi:antitoxin MazE